MKTLLISLTASLISLASASALPNLIGNGDFATNALPPWTSTGTNSAAGGSCSLNGTISQTIVTEVGKTYYVALDAGASAGAGVTVKATPSGSGTPDGTATTSFTAHIGFTFDASSTSTVISVAGAPPAGGFGSAPTADNVVCFLLAPSKLTGKYTGTLGSTLALTAGGLKQKDSTRLAARVDVTGRIIILDGTTRVYAGRIFNDGTFDLQFGNSNGGRQTGTAATAAGGRIDLTIPGAPLIAADEISVPIAVGITRRIVMTRVGD